MVIMRRLCPGFLFCHSPPARFHHNNACLDPLTWIYIITPPTVMTLPSSNGNETGHRLSPSDDDGHPAMGQGDDGWQEINNNNPPPLSARLGYNFQSGMRRSGRPLDLISWHFAASNKWHYTLQTRLLFRSHLIIFIIALQSSILLLVPFSNDPGLETDLWRWLCFHRIWEMTAVTHSLYDPLIDNDHPLGSDGQVSQIAGPYLPPCHPQKSGTWNWKLWSGQGDHHEDMTRTVQRTE